MTYEELMSILDKADEYLSTYDIRSSLALRLGIDLKQTETNIEKLILENVAKIAYEAAASDCKSWFVKDSTLNKIHIGDIVDTPFDGNVKVKGFINIYDTLQGIVYLQDGKQCWELSEICQMVNGDARENLIERLVAYDLSEETAKEIIDKAIALGAEQ